MLDALLTQLATAPAVLVTVAATSGSVPRECGAWMAVFADTTVGTIGGGHFEFAAIAQARAQLGQPLPQASHERRFALGPSLGQCCGGVVHLRFETASAVDTAMLRSRLQPTRTPVALFGGGHVGVALVQVLGRLPFAVHWIDSRDEVFPAVLPLHIKSEHSVPVHQGVDSLLGGSHVLIMSFSHAEDLDIVAACLLRHRQHNDLPFIGLMGSKTKWATFRHRLLARGFTEAELAHVTCPIGLAGIRGKQPEVIAVAVVAQLLLHQHTD